MNTGLQPIQRLVMMAAPAPVKIARRCAKQRDFCNKHPLPAACEIIHFDNPGN
jgi:hypothetical protein